MVVGEELIHCSGSGGGGGGGVMLSISTSIADEAWKVMMALQVKEAASLTAVLGSV